MFDIKKLAIASTGTMPICDVDGNPQFDDKGNALSITFHSPGTREFAQAKHDHEESLSKRLMKMQGGRDKTDPDQELKNISSFLTRCTVSLNNFTYEGGPKALYEDRSLGHIAQDANKYLGERGNFKLNSASVLSNTSDTQPG